MREGYKPETFMVVMLDGRGFGEINKRHGHNTGDNVRTWWEATYALVDSAPNSNVTGS